MLTDLTAEFAVAMEQLGPFGPERRVAVAVSGGADSMALALLASGWGRAVALVVDHGLRPGSDAEARVTADALRARDIETSILTLHDLLSGAAQSERARTARYGALVGACHARGLPDLLLGHHLRDQAETVAMRRQHGSGAAGLAAMSAVSMRDGVRMLRPVLGIAPGRLRALLRQAGLEWVEDPTNSDPASERARVRAWLQDDAGDAPGTLDLAEAARQEGRRRAVAEAGLGALLARVATIRDDGVVHLTVDALPAEALGRLLRVVAGRERLPRLPALARIAGSLQPSTLAGAMVLPAGRVGGGWLLAREPSAMGGPMAAMPGAVWDSRFRVPRQVPAAPGVLLAALGADAAKLRHLSVLPAVAMRSLPAYYCKTSGRLLAVPHLNWPAAPWGDAPRPIFSPRIAVHGAAFMPVAA